MCKDANSYKCLSKFIKPEMLGDIVGTGFNSVAIVLEEKWRVELNFNYILIVSLEKEKELFLKKMVGVKTRKINTRKVSKDIKECITFLKDESFSVFYMEKLQEIPWEYFPIERIEHIEEFFRLINRKFSNIFCKYDLFWILKEIKLIAKKHGGVDDFYRAIKKSLKAIQNSSIDSRFRFDLHMGQFMFNEKNELVCIDPVLFNYKNYSDYIRDL